MKFGGFPALTTNNWRITDDEIKSKLISGAVISSFFYTFQTLLQGIHWSLRIHAGLPKIVTFPVGLTSTVLSLSLSQTAEFLLRQQTNDYTNWDLASTRRRRYNSSVPEIVSDQVSRLVLGIGFFMLLEQSLFRTALPSSVIRPGVYANFLNRNQRSIISSSAVVSEVERRKIQILGRWYGCHHCGDRQWFVPKVFIGDHMPPTKFAVEMSNKGLRKLFNRPVRQRLWPQCNKCFLLQGSAVRMDQHKLVFHKLFRRHHLAPGLASLAMLQPDIATSVKETTKPLSRQIVKQWEKYTD